MTINDAAMNTLSTLNELVRAVLESRVSVVTTRIVDPLGGSYSEITTRIRVDPEPTPPIRVRMTETQDD